MYLRPTHCPTQISIKPTPHLHLPELILWSIAGFAAVLLSVALLPHSARAFWFFNREASAATVHIPNSSTPTLAAAESVNPSASLPLALPTSDDSALLANSGPSGSAAMLGNGAGGKISVYVVRPGDTLSDIAKMFGVSINTILWANNLRSTRDVHPGDTLIILPVSGVRWTIKKGDTLKSLAKKFGADVEEIAFFNGLDESAPLLVGETIIIPGGEIAAPAPARSATPRSSPLRVGGGPTLLGYFINPVPTGRLTQDLHGWNGVDFGAARGTPIYAAASGMVIVSRSSGYNGGYGKYVVVTHDNGVQTLYAHMSQTAVAPGESVIQGQLIGYVGSTGRSTGNHLHFEVRGAKNPFAN